MTLKFCRKCKTLLRPQNKKGKIILECFNCGLIDDIQQGDLISKNKINVPDYRGKGSVDDKDIFANYDHTCKKCGHDKAEIIDVGIFYSDEDNLIMLKCGKCGFSERIGKKTS